MKRQILFFVLTFLTLQLKAQTGIPFAQDNAHWSQKASYIYVTGPGQPPQCMCFYQQAQVKGDTIINNKFLQKVFGSASSTFDSLCLNFGSYIYYDSNRVYSGADPNSLILMYDFNLQLGDSFTFNTSGLSGPPTFIMSSYTLAVDSVDSINIGGVLRKRIRFTRIPYYAYLQDPIQWVEGIGDLTYGWVFNYGIIVFFNYINTGYVGLLCYSDSNVSLGNCIYGNCNPAAIPDLFLPNSISCSPNPVNDKLFISSIANAYSLKLQLHNILGENILQKEYSNFNSTIELDVSEIKNGIYFLSLTQEEKISTYKIIIHH